MTLTLRSFGSSDRYPKFSMVSLGVVMVTSWMTTVYISVWHQYKARIQEPFEMFDPLYDKPWSRIGPYLVGKENKMDYSLFYTPKIIIKLIGYSY